MMSLSILDWVIVLIVVLSVLQAIGQGFFYEFFSLAGVIAGYLLAAWEYPRVAAWYEHYVNSPWTADIAGFFTIFVAGDGVGGSLGQVHTLHRARGGVALVRSPFGSAFWLHSRGGHQRGDGAGAGRICSAVGTAAVADCAFPVGDQPWLGLGGAGGLAAALLGRLEPVAYGTAASPDGAWRKR